MDLTPIIVAGIAAIAAVTSVVVQVVRDRKRTTADSASVIEQTSSRIADRNSRLEIRVDQQEDRIRALELQLTASFYEVDGLRSGINILVDQLRANGMTPIWTPDRVKTVPRSPEAAK